MFERYTEKARRAIFFSRHEAGQSKSNAIEPAHVMLGVLRGSRDLRERLGLPEGFVERLRALSTDAGRKRVAGSVDVPFSDPSKRALAYAAEEADKLGHKTIETAHLFLGLVREEIDAPSMELREQGADPVELQTRVMLALRNRTEDE